MADWSYLSPAEYEKISSVLKRDRELRSLEEIRIKQLKQELVCLRKRAALRPGLDTQRNCARCLTELGRIINRGALCPLCKKKVCKECRNYGDENHEWLCVCCYKQIQLKAVSGEWMHEFSKLSVRTCAKDPPGDQLRKVLHESQRKGLFDPEAERRKSSYAAEIPPVKPPRSIQCDQSPVSEDPPIDSVAAKCYLPEATTAVEIEKKLSDFPSLSPKVLPRVSPWNGIDPEPTIPRRVDQSRPFGAAQQYEYSLENYAHRERQSSDEGHCTIGCRSRSTSSEVIDESDNLTPVPLPRKRLSPLKKQQAVPEPSAVENQQSSVDTVDSGVFSPGLKLENSIDSTAPPSPLAVSRLSSVEQETVENPSNRPPLLAQCLAKGSSSSENEADTLPANPLTIKSSDALFRKVTLKKRKYGSGPKGLKEKRSATLSADVHPVAPPTGLKSSFSNNNNNNKSYIPFNSNNTSNSKRKLTRFETNIPNNSKVKKPIISSSLIPKLKNKEVTKSSNSRKHVEISFGSTLPNSEALSDGRNKHLKTDRNHEKEVSSSPGEDKLLIPVQKCRIPRGQAVRRTREHRRRVSEPKEKQTLLGKNNAFEAHTKKVVQTKQSSDSNFIPKSSKRVYKRNVEHPNSTNQSSENENVKALVSHKISKNFKEFKSTTLQFFSEYPNRLFRSASLPHRKTFINDWLHSWLWRCHSLEDWLWCMEDQPNETRHFNQINILPDDYKLVYVSSSSASSDSDEISTTNEFHMPVSPVQCHNFNLDSKSNLRMQSHIKMNCDTSYIKDSDWELESNGGDEFDLTFTFSKSKTLIQVSEVNNFFVHHNLHTEVKRDHEQKQHCSSKVKKSRCRSHHSTIRHDFWLQEILLSKLTLKKPVSIKMDNCDPFSHTICFPKFKNYIKLFSCFQLNFYLSQLILIVTSSNCGIKTDTAVDTSTRCVSPLSSNTDSQWLIAIHLNDKEKSKTSTIIYISIKDFVTYCLSIIYSCLIPAQNDTLLKVVHDIFDDNMFSKNCNSLNFYNCFNVLTSLPSYPCLFNLLRVFVEIQNVFFSYLYKNGAIFFQSQSVSERILTDTEKNSTVTLWEADYEINCNFGYNFHLKVDSLLYSLPLKTLKLLSERGISYAALFHDYGFITEDASISIISECSKLYKHGKSAKQHLISPFSITHEAGQVAQSDVISPENLRLAAGRCGSQIDFLPQYKFRNPTWRCEKAGNPLYPGDAASPPQLTNRSGNKKALVTGWGQERCCIARRRVIDLLRALCGREVLADLTALLRCTGVSSSAKHGGTTVNAFFYHAPPVALEPEVDYLLRLTRSEPRLLFQLGTSLGVVARMLTIKSEEATAGVQADYVDKVCHRELGKGVGAMEIEEAESFVESASRYRELAPPNESRSGGGGCKKLLQTPGDERKLTAGACCANGNAPLNTADVGHIDTFDFQTAKQNVECNSEISEVDFNHDKALEIRDSLCHWDSEVLSCVKNIFCEDSWYESSVSCKSAATDFYPQICMNVDLSERVDCKCNKPCDVPLSPSVVDATVDVRNFTEDGDILSSGDELDKIESDTDSQDTVIEGEAYKRIRSVAIKEKILHANEELFGVDCKELCYNRDSHKFSNTETTERNSKTRFDIEEITRKALQSFFLEDHQNDIPKFLCSSLQENKTFETHSSTEHNFKPFKTTELSAFHPVSPSSFVEKKKDQELSDCRNLLIESSSYNSSYCENLCSSESSDNGSDGEEVLFSDTSTSSDEATYIAPSSGFRYYNQPLSYRLHTIVEESCEESEKSSRGATPTSRANSEFEYYDKPRVASSKNAKKVIRKPVADATALGHTKNVKSSTSYAVLATSRLEKYFKSGLLEGEVSYLEDDLTDESGGISSDDDVTSLHLNNKFKNEHVSTKLSVEKQNRKTISTTNDRLAVKSFSNLSPDTSLHKKYASYSEAVKKSKRNDSNNALSYKLESSNCNQKQIKDSEPSDEDAKYIMSHLMQHISNDTEDKIETTPDAKDVSPMLKILESEIARLMLTVSPASLSAGEPSSSCSSTIGSNNSDYGSDTLESAEETTSDEEIHADIVPENRALVELVPQNDTVSIVDTNEASSTSIDDSSNNSQIVDSAVSEETLYICKQLMASLKKIADATEGTVASDEFSCNAEDHSAKQYITDQIISLMQTVSASHNSPLLRTLTLNTSHAIQLDSDVSQGRSDSDSPSPNGEKRGLPKSKTPSESGSETTISASISIPSYDDSDRTPTESEISHEMDELYALLENNGTHQDIISAKFSYDLEAISQEKVDCLQCVDSPVSEGESSSDSCDMNSTLSESHSSLLSGAASKLESLLPITIEERIARYKKAFMTKTDEKESETRINVILPQPSKSNLKHNDDLSLCRDSELPCFSTTLKAGESCDIMPCSSNASNNEEGYNITSVKIISHNTYPLSSAIHKILSSNIDSKYLEQKLDYQIVNILDASAENTSCDTNLKDEKFILEVVNNELCEDSQLNTIVPLPKVMNPKEKASSENDLLVANYRAKSKGSKVFGTKSVGNISELENTNSKSAFRDTGYYSFKSSEESFLSLDDSTASQTSTTSLTQYRSLTSTETIPEEEESCAKGVSTSKMSLSSSNIPDAVCDTSASKSSTLPLSLRNKLSGTPGGNHRSRSSFFSTSGVLRKLTQLRDESGNSLRSSPHGRLRMRNRSLSGGSEDGKQRKSSVPQISVSECSEIAHLSAASSEKDSSGIHEDEIDQAFAYHCRSQMSLSSFGGRSESVTSVYSAAGGGRYGTVTVTGEVLFGLIYNHKASILEINIKECRNLAAVDTKRNRSDPYVKAYLLPDRTKSGKRKTKVKKHTLNPSFDESLKFHVSINELVIRTLWLSVWHSDRFGRNDFLGEVMLPLGNDAVENSCSKWYPLQERLETLDTPVSYKGDLILALKYVPPDVTSRKFSKKPGIPVKGALEVLVREARNLMATRSNGTSDPFCKSYLLPDKSKSGKQKTPVFKKSCNPKWNHTFVYDDVSLDDLRERCLELTIWDYDKITSNDFLGGVRLCLGTGKYQGRDVDWMDSVGEERSLWYTMLERPNTWVDGSLLLRPNMQSRRMV